jgi:hypothetical protein
MSGFKVRIDLIVPYHSSSMLRIIVDSLLDIISDQPQFQHSEMSQLELQKKTSVSKNITENLSVSLRKRGKASRQERAQFFPRARGGTESSSEFAS